MSSSKLVRWSGMAATVGAILIAILELTEFILFGSLTGSQMAATGAVPQARGARTTWMSENEAWASGWSGEGSGACSAGMP